MVTRTKTLAATAASLSIAGAVMTPSALAAGSSYVALGDSYSAGVGTRDSINTCYQSPYGYAPLIAAQQGLSLDYQACSGATTADVQADQLGTLNSSTGKVTITIGGNDVGFSSVLTECALPAWMSDCAGAVAGGRAILEDQMPGRYDSLFAAIRAKAPNADVVVAGYPHIFNGEDCNALTFFSPSDEQLIDDATDDLDTLEHGKANAHGFSWVDVRSQFTGHEVCGVDGEWLNGLSYPITESYHPNRDGNQAYAAAISPVLTGSPMAAPHTSSSTRSSRATSLDRLPDVDLTSKASLRGAKRAGLNPSTIVRLAADLHSGDRARVAHAVTRLEALDRRAERNLHRMGSR